jgi:chemotaxis protein histidine kinase CheA
MKIHSLALSALLAGSSSAFVQQTPSVKRATSLQAQQNDWFGPAVVAAAGWAMAAQLSFAAPAEEQVTLFPDAPVQEKIMASNVQEELVPSNTMTISAFGGNSFETVDFSLPSYDQAVGKATKAFDQLEAPKFVNPFGSSDSEDKTADEAKDDTKAAVETAKQDKQAEREAAKAEREAAKAEAEAKKAEEKAAAEKAKAEKEARKQEQLEKQRAAVERQKERSKSEVKEEAKGDTFSMPDMPKFEAPKFEAPDMPKFEAPDIKLPDKASFSMPDMPKFDMPKTPDIKLDLPKAPTFDMPNVDLPKVDMPKISLPSFGGGGGGDANQNVADTDLEPQEVRDARAKDARNVFLDYDKTAKDLEKKAREARDNANEKKKIAKAFKDEACKTRPGGKFLCLRPFGSGY